MSGVPYIRLFGDDWLSGTNELSLEERGALITIVALTSTTGEAPRYELDRLARRFGCTKGKAKKVLQSLTDLGKISISDEVVRNDRALKETEISSKNSQKQTENANARWSKKDKKPNENNTSIDATALPPQCQPEPEPEPYINTAPTLKPERETAAVGSILFEEFLEAYPRTEGQSRSRAISEWNKLSPDQQTAAVEAVPKLKPELAKMRGGGWMPFVYLRDRIFETVATERNQMPALVRPAEGTPAGNLFDLIVASEGESAWSSWFAGCEFRDNRIYPPKRFVEDTIRKRWSHPLEKSGLELMEFDDPQANREAA